MRLKDFIGSCLIVSFDDEGRTFEKQCEIVEWSDWFSVENYDISIEVIREAGYGPDEPCVIDCKILKCFEPIKGHFAYSTSNWEMLNNDKINLNITLCKEAN
jgi:hypothetical protein